MNQPVNINITKLKPSATVVINERSNELIFEGKMVYKFGLGQSPFPVPENVTETKTNNAHLKDYLPVRGLSGLRESVANCHSQIIGE